MLTTLNERCKPHLPSGGLHTSANHTKNEMLKCTVVSTPYMVCYAHFRFNGEYTWVYTRYTWVYMGIHEYAWVYMSIHGCTQGIHGYTWIYTGIHKVYSSIHGYTQGYT